MTGSKLRLLAWLLPLLVAGAFWIRLHDLRTAPQELVAPPAPIAVATVPTVIAPKPISDEAEAVDRLRQELAQLRARIATREHQLRSAPLSSTPEPKPHDITEDFLPFKEWRDMGSSKPAALAETALWAGAGGDVQRMASLLTFDEDGLAAANALLERLPADLRPPGADGRALIALLSTDAVPLTSAKLVGDFPLDTGELIVVLQLKPAADAAPGTRSRNVKLTARQDPASAEWRFVVPQNAVESFGRKLGLSP